MIQEESADPRTWSGIGGVVGLFTVVAYAVTKFDFFPAGVARLLFFGVSVGGVVFVLALGQLLRAHRRSPVQQVGTVFGIIGFTCMNLMAVVQWSSLMWMKMNPPAGIDPELKRWVWQSVMSVQLGFDVCFDIFFDLSLVLFGVAMLRHPRFGPVFGVLGIGVAAATLALNLAAFPVPPTPDLGPLIGLWAGAVAVRLLLLRRGGQVSEPAVASAS